jgi:RteC protein
MNFENIKNEYENYKNSISEIKIINEEYLEQNQNPYQTYKIGDKLLQIRQPKNKKEAFEFFEKYDSIKIFLSFVNEFTEKRVLNITTLTDELVTITDWIQNAKIIKIDEATNVYNPKFNPSKIHENEYIKLLCNHYSKQDFHNYISFFETAPIVKAKYFLYKEWLESEVEKIENTVKVIFKKNIMLSQIIETKDNIHRNNLLKSDNSSLIDENISEDFTNELNIPISILQIIKEKVENHYAIQNVFNGLQSVQNQVCNAGIRKSRKQINNTTFLEDCAIVVNQYISSNHAHKILIDFENKKIDVSIDFLYDGISNLYIEKCVNENKKIANFESFENLEAFEEFFDLYYLIDGIIHDKIVLEFCLKLENNKYRPILNTKLTPKSKNINMDFSNVKKNLMRLSSTTEKIKYLIEIKTEFQQDSGLLDFGDDNFLKKCNLEIDKLKELLEIENTNPTLKIQTITEPQKTLNWQGDKIEFLELIKALIVNGTIDINKNSQKETITILSKVFNIEIKNPDQTINKIKLRNNGSETLFLDKLKTSLFKHITVPTKK